MVCHIYTCHNMTFYHMFQSDYEISYNYQGSTGRDSSRSCHSGGQMPLRNILLIYAYRDMRLLSR